MNEKYAIFSAYHEENCGSDPDEVKRCDTLEEAVAWIKEDPAEVWYEIKVVFEVSPW